MKKLFTLLFVVFICTGLSACDSGNSDSNRDLLDFKSAYDTELGYLVSLGMTKSSVDEMLETPNETDSFYFYMDDSLALEYKDGKVSAIHFSDSRWVIEGDIGVGTSITTLGEDWIVRNNVVVKGYTNSGKLLSYEDFLDRDVTVSLIYEDGTVSLISISY